MAKGARELNVPAFRQNRKLVASKDGGLHNPSVLTFNSDWNKNRVQRISPRFNYPQAAALQRPVNEEDIAFMSASHQEFEFFSRPNLYFCSSGLGAWRSGKCR